MRKTIFFIASTLLLIACGADEISNEGNQSAETNKSVSTVWVKDGNICCTRANDGVPTLCFKDEESLRKFEQQLSDLPDEEKKELINSYGISTLYDIADDADDELETLCNQASSEEEFKSLYKNYEKKYEGILIRNDIDTTDLTLYVPDEDNILSYIGNENKEYVIGNEVCNVSLQDNLSESMKRMSMAVSRPSYPPVNTFVYSPKKGKRVYFDSYMRGVRMWVKMNCKKKMWYGWKNDPNRSYYFDTYFGSNFVYLALGRYGQEVVVSRLPRFVFNKNVKRGFCIILGKITSGAVLEGEIHTWTDMTSERDARGREIILNTNGYYYPKCDEGRSYNVRIKLK